MPRPYYREASVLFLFVSFFCFSEAQGFHDLEILDCKGCHGLKKSAPSSVCLHCHAEKFRVLSKTGNAYTPGGDFFWLNNQYSVGQSLGDGNSHGHNVLADEFDLQTDALLPSAPSDGKVKYLAAWMSCTSCHDPHQSTAFPGKGYRLLGGTDYNGGKKTVKFKFKFPSPVARPSERDYEDWRPESDANHADYRTGMSEWCSNCHSGYTSNPSLSHAAGAKALFGDIAQNYNSYDVRRNAFDFLIPFERGAMDDEATSKDITAGPNSSSNVICLSCHRSHASAFSNIGRWDFKVEFLANSPILAITEGAHAFYGQSITARYGRKQKTLCNKCHSKG